MSDRIVKTTDGKWEKAGGDPGGKRSGGIVELFLAELRAVTPTLVLIGPIAASLYLLWGAMKYIRYDAVGAEGMWAPAQYSNLAWVALLSLMVLFGLGLRRKGSGTLTMVGLAGQVLFGCAAAAFSIAWATERQNYWDAYHFAAVLWTAIGGAVLGTLGCWIAGRRGSHVAQVLLGPAVVCLLIALLAWSWTWSDTVQEIEGWIARALWLATHG